VEERLAKALVSAVNCHEVFAKLLDRGLSAEEVASMLSELGSALRSSTPTAGLSLGDRSCLALALHREATAVTTDRAWEKLVIGIVLQVVR
jgi:PIN domain nuclease of toxin-antitoxin system